MASSPIMSMKPPRIGTHCLATSARGPRQSAARRNRVGLDARKDPRRPAGGEKCLLTSPFIGLPIESFSISETIARRRLFGILISAITLVFLLGLSAFGLLFLAAGGFLVASSQVLRLGFQLGFGRLPTVLDCFVAHSFLHDRVAIVTINQSRRDKLQAES